MTKEFFSFTDDDLDNMDNDDIVSRLPENVVKWYTDYMDESQSHLLFAMSGCKTPIEQIMAMHLYYAFHKNIGRLAMYGLEIIGFEPQAEFEFDGKKYFADFCIPVICHLNKSRHIFIVECDGHDFHEKTKLQARKDKEREREFVKAGHTVIRFTGSEIIQSNCGHDVFEIIINHFKNKGK